MSRVGTYITLMYPSAKSCSIASVMRASLCFMLLALRSCSVMRVFLGVDGEAIAFFVLAIFIITMPFDSLPPQPLSFTGSI
jgi:hypothetical protein